MRKQKQGERHIIDVIYEDIIEPMFEKNSGVVLKKTMYYKELFNEKIDNGKVLASGLRNHNVRLSERKKENMWEKSNTNWLSDYFRNAENFEEIILNIKNELKEYIKKFISNINAPIYEDLSIEKLIVILIICEDGNYIETERISKNVKFYLREDLKEKLKGLLGINSEEPEFESKRVISISGPKLSGRHTLVEDVLKEVRFERIYIKEQGNKYITTKNGVFVTEAETFFKKHQFENIIFRQSLFELMNNISTNKRLAIILDVDNVNSPKLNKTEIEIVEIVKKIDRNNLSIILIGQGDGDIKTSLYSKEELFNIFLEKKGYKTKEEITKLGIQEEQLREYCEIVRGQVVLIELLAKVLEEDDTNDGTTVEKSKQGIKSIDTDVDAEITPSFDILIEHIFGNNQRLKEKKFRVRSDKISKNLKGNIKKVFGEILKNSEKSLLYLLSCFDTDYVPILSFRHLINEIDEVIIYLEKIGWVDTSELGIRVKLSSNLILNLINNKEEKEEIKQVMEKFINQFNVSLSRTDLINSFKGNLRGLASVSTSLLKKIKIIGVNKKTQLDFYKRAILFFLDVRAVNEAKIFLREYEESVEEKDMTYFCFEICVNFIEGNRKCYNAWISNHFETQIKEFDILSNEDQIAFLFLMKFLLDIILDEIVFRWEELKGWEEGKEFAEDLSGLIAFATYYEYLLGKFRVIPQDLIELSKRGKHFQIIFRVHLFLLYKVLVSYFSNTPRIVAEVKKKFEEIKYSRILNEIHELSVFLVIPESSNLLAKQEKFSFIEDVLFCVFLNDHIDKTSRANDEDFFGKLVRSDVEYNLKQMRNELLGFTFEYSWRLEKKVEIINKWEKYISLNNER